MSNPAPSNQSHVNAISGRLSLRTPQRESLTILDRITQIVPLRGNADLTAALDFIRSEYPDSCFINLRGQFFNFVVVKGSI